MTWFWWILRVDPMHQVLEDDQAGTPPPSIIPEPCSLDTYIGAGQYT